MSTKRLFVRPRRKDNDDDSDDEERQRQRKARRTLEAELKVSNGGGTALLEAAVAAVELQIRHPQAKPGMYAVSVSCTTVTTDDGSLEKLSAVALKPFQRDGVRWMVQQSHSRGLGVVLADEMGCGKTIQTIVTYLVLRESAIKQRGSADAEDKAFTMLVIAPLSVNPTWEREIQHVTRGQGQQPSSCALRVLCYGGSRDERTAIIDRVEASILSRRRRLWDSDHDDNNRGGAKPTTGGGGNFRQGVFDVIITTPEYILSDSFFLAKLHYDVLVVDEAHRLKNADSLLYRCLREQYVPRAHFRFLLTGTPLSNTPSDLWNLLALVNPAFLRHDIPRVGSDGAGSDASRARQATAFFQVDRNRNLLKQLASLLVLRRLKKDVLGFLPPITEVVVQVPLSPLQLRLYASILRKDLELLSSLLMTTDSTAVAAATGSTTQAARRMSLLNVVVQLRKCCNHPYLFSGVEPEPFVNGEHLVRASGKLAVLDVLLKKLASEGHRVLLFSQFTAALDVLQDYLTYRRLEYLRLDGSVRGDVRDDVVQAFQTGRSVGVDETSFASDDVEVDVGEPQQASGTQQNEQEMKRARRQRPPFVFLLSTRAGGVGLTLTAADTVIFFDHDWNPMMDRQAQERAHRIGQDKPVTIYRLCTQHTVEETMLLVASKKFKVAQDILQGVEESGLLRSGDDDYDETDASEKLSAAALRNLIRLGVAALPASSFTPTCSKAQMDEQEALWKSAVAGLNIENLLVTREAASSSPSPVRPTGVAADAAAPVCPTTTTAALVASNTVATTMTTLEDALAVKEQEAFKASLTAGEAVLKRLYESAVATAGDGEGDGKRRRTQHRHKSLGEGEEGGGTSSSENEEPPSRGGAAPSRARKPHQQVGRAVCSRSVDAERILRSRKKWKTAGYFTSALPLDGELLSRCMQLCANPSQLHPPVDVVPPSLLPAASDDEATTTSAAAADPSAVFLAESFSHWTAAAWPGASPPSYFFSATASTRTHAAEEFREDAGLLGESDGLQHVTGDLFDPIADLPTTLRIVIVPVNNSGVLGSGRLFDAVRALCPNAAAQYLAAKDNGDLRMGDVHLLWIPNKHHKPHHDDKPHVATTLQVALVVIQKSSTADRSTGGDVDLKELGNAMERLRCYVQLMAQCRAGSLAATADAVDLGGSGRPPRSAHHVTLHFPQFAALSKEAAYALDKTLVKHLADGTRCYCYHASRRSPPRRPPAPPPPLSPRVREDRTVFSRERLLDSDEGNGNGNGRQGKPGISAADCFFVFASPAPSDVKSNVARKVLAAGGVFLAPDAALRCVRSGEVSPSQLVVLLDDNIGTEAAAHSSQGTEDVQAFLSQVPDGAIVTSVENSVKLLISS